ncbi:hypothetical protein F8M41_012648 [Gigaspora margarita]|uniref:Uncharacterized protein n=1 Tax=Gigaspora margarita TaxID=4874 RepID=A0A8H4A1S9_GIGMA|nr:hypothetical protein F8M41_012648 [Gigaspora margarita]
MCTFSNDVLSPLTLADWAIFVMEGLPGDLDEKLDELTGYSKWIEKFRLNNKDKNIEGRFKAFPLKFKEWNHLELSGGYSDDEFREWCKLRNYNIDEDPQLKLHLDKVKFWTESYPLELDLWHWTDEINFENKTSKYMNKRESEIALAHEAFRDRLSEEEKQILTTVKPGGNSPVYNNVMNMHKVIKFMGNGTPVESFDVNLHTLFIPLSPNYPGVDFLI